jgi:hypothetical protein
MSDDLKPLSLSEQKEAFRDASEVKTNMHDCRRALGRERWGRSLLARSGRRPQQGSRSSQERVRGLAIAGRASRAPARPRLSRPSLRRLLIWADAK